MNEEKLEALQFDYLDALKEFNEQFQLSWVPIKLPQVIEHFIKKMG